jgi:hypothetical protein
MSNAAGRAFILGVVLCAGARSAQADATMGSLAPRDAAAATTTQQQWLTDPRAKCQALDAEYAPGDAIAWQGGCVAGIASGSGRLTFLNNGRVIETITGTFGDGALLPGHASAVWSDGSRYDGGQSGGQFDGEGRFVSANGNKTDGQWKAGALNGRATMLWANGDRYDGNWAGGKADGEGTEIWANGDRYEGLWQDGKPLGTREGASNSADSAATIPDRTSVVDAAAVGSSAQPQFSPQPQSPAQATASAPQARSGDAPVQEGGADYPLRDLVGPSLVAVDGSTLALDLTEAGLVRTVTLPGGVTEQTSFSFINDRIGTVSGETTAIGVFRAGSEGIDTDYANGDIETMKRVAGGGLLLALHTADGETACTAWYPEGHLFTQEEKKTAVEEYARRLGISESSPQKKRHAGPAANVSCGGGFAIHAARAASSPEPRQMAAEPDTMTAVATGASAASPTSPPKSAAPLVTNDLQAVPVKDAPVHLIDTPFVPASAQPAVQNVKFTADASAGQSTLQRLNSPVEIAPTNATECLSVGSDGAYWGFRNRCAKAVQFAYCEMSDANPLTSCRRTSVSGSVAANGFSPLVNDRSLSEQSVDHEFRWMACQGGAGEVVPHLDTVKPPGGRCVRAVPSAGANPSQGGS